jgi:hypothetical protein
MTRIFEVLLLVGFGLGIGYLLLSYPPIPPPGVCDANGTPEACSDWWNDLMERP